MTRDVPRPAVDRRALISTLALLPILSTAVAPMPASAQTLERSSVKFRLFIVVFCSVAMTCAAALAQSSSVSPSGTEALAFGVLVGRWVRVEGGYLININAVGLDRKIEASYANPKPLPFSTAEATHEGNALKLFFELRARGYGGSTYTLNYDAVSDTLRGVYNQVVVKQRFDVVFIRAK